MKRLFFTLLFALPLFANHPVVLQPVAPTSNDPIEFQIATYCGGETLSTTRVGSVIKIEVSTFAVPCDPPIQFIRATRIDPLPPGRYRVEVFEQGVDFVYATREFFVRSGEAKTLEVHPSVLPAGADENSHTRMRINRTNFQSICSGTCDGVTIRVGGVVVTDAKTDANGIYAWFTPPPREEPGLVDIELQYGDAIERHAFAVAYTNRLDASLYERILFPVLDDLRGANGSHWVSEVVFANPNFWYADLGPNIAPISCVTSPCGTDRLSPNSYTSYYGGDFPHGALLIAPRDDANALSFSLRVRDISRVADTYGTQIPVVRERDMQRNTTLVLPDVPRDPKYRVKLRVYAIEPYGSDPLHSWVHIVNAATGAEKTESVEYAPGESIVEPAYAELDLPAGTEGERSAIYIEPAFNTLTWAFVTITNNETQQVTIVTPSGGGRDMPCFTCREP